MTPKNSSILETHSQRSLKSMKSKHLNQTYTLKHSKIYLGSNSKTSKVANKENKNTNQEPQDYRNEKGKADDVATAGCLNMLSIEEKYIHSVLEHLKRGGHFSVNLKEA